MLFHHDLCCSYKQVQLPLQQHGFNVRACGLIKGQVSLAAPRVLLNVVDLHSEGALVVSADASNIVDAVLIQGSQTLTSRDTHWGKMTPIVLTGIKAEEIFTCRKQKKLFRSQITHFNILGSVLCIAMPSSPILRQEKPWLCNFCE